MAQKETQIMKKNIRAIVIFSVIAVILAGLLILLTVTAPAEEEKTEEAAPASKLLYDKNPKDISKLTVKNEHGEYEIIRIGEGDGASWTITDIANMPISSAQIGTLIESAGSVTSQKTVAENPEDISIYGFNEPSAVVTAAFSDSANTVRTLTVGNPTPDEIMRYIMVDGDKAVYAVYGSAVKCFLNDRNDVISKVVYTAKTAESADDTTNYTKINKITINRSDLDYDFVVEYDVRNDDDSIITGNASGYVVTSPVFRDLNPDKSKDFTGNIFGLTASGLGPLNPSEEELAACGIDESAAKVTFEINGGDTVRLVIGKEYINEAGKKAGRYATVNDAPLIYIFDESSLPWLTAKPLDIVTTMITSNYVFTVRSMEITGSGVNMSFTMTGSSNADFAVKLNGAEVDKDKFKTFYQFILRMPSEEIYFEETDAEPTVSINITTENGSDLIEFLPAEGRKAIIRLNGKTVYKCASAYVDRLLDNIRLYENGEDIIDNW